MVDSQIGQSSTSGANSDDSDGSTPGSTLSPPQSSPPPSSPPPAPPSNSSSSTPPPSPPSNSSSSSPPPAPPADKGSPPAPPADKRSPPAPPADKGSPLAPPADKGSLPVPTADQGSPPSNALPSLPSNGGGSSSDSRSSKDDDKNERNDNDSPPVGAIVAGAVIGVLAFGLLLGIAACVCCSRRKKKRDAHINMPSYTDERGNVYYANSMPKWQNSGSVDQNGGWQHQSQYTPGLAPLSEDMRGSNNRPPPSPGMAMGFGSQSSFSYDELASATGGFSRANLLGQGGFGYVYKGVLPGSGKEVAVKQLKAGSGQGEREFQAEVEIISRVHHRHLVSLVGYCIAGSSQRLLVYEFVPNSTLEHHLYGKGVPVMDWPTRLTIALGSAKGLAYLHEDCHPKIIHRDIKAANILLEENFEAKVADFGLAKLTNDTNTHVSTRVMGTFGYLAPEYASSGKLTDKSDVFSFGVMLLELITGRRPVDLNNYAEDSLVDWASPLLERALSEEGNFDELVDPRLENKYERLEMERMAACAAAAVLHSAKRRPKMKQIVRALEGDASLEDQNEGVKPGQSMMHSSGSEYESGNYASKINKFRQIAFESTSEEYSNEYSGTGESGEATRRHH